MTNVCKNPECGKNYEVKKNETDDGFCCFECWEAVNCLEPEEKEIPEYIEE